MSDIPIPGVTQLSLQEEKGFVKIVFPHPVAYAVLDPDTASRVADTMKEYSISCRGGKYVVPATPQDLMDLKISNKLPMLRKRVAFRLRKLAEAGKSNADAAADVIDLILSEVC